MRIREVRLDDAKEICRIYNYYIEYTTITFETEPVQEDEMRERIHRFVKDGNFYFVAEKEEKLVGYCYLHSWYNRAAYDATKEISIYIDQQIHGKGIGTILYQHLFKAIYKTNLHALIAGICVPNDNSVRLHEKFGFYNVSAFKELGWKFDQWLDVGHWLLVIKQIPPRILIVDVDNSCYSQIAHGFLQSFDPKLLVYSAGTNPAKQVNSQAIAVMNDAGINISHHTPTSVETFLHEDWDYVITMGDIAKKDLLFLGNIQHQLHMELKLTSIVENNKLSYTKYLNIRDNVKKHCHESYMEKIKKENVSKL